MTPDAYFNTYKQYKAGTREIVRWLVEETSYEIPQGQGSQNGARDASKLPVHVFPILARQIMSSITPSNVSQHIRSILNWVITARKECATQHKFGKSGSNVTSNEKHDHFIRALQEVQNILRALPTDRAPECITGLRSHSGTTESSPKMLTNLFDNLELHEPTQWIFQSNHTGYSDSEKDRPGEEPAQIPEIIEADISETEDGMFASFCFLQDCDRVRQYVRSVWEDYRQRRVSLSVAALTTNVAFDIIERLHADFGRVSPKHSTYEALEQLILDDSTTSSIAGRHLEPSTSALYGSVDPDSFETSSLGRETFSVLKHYREDYQNRVFRDFGIEDNQFDWSTLCTGSHMERIPILVETILTRAIPDVVCFMLSVGGSNSPVDELSCNLLAFYESHKITVPLVVSCEIFSDIHFVLLGDIQRPFLELSSSADQAELAMKKSETHVNLLKTDCSSFETRASFKTLRNCMRLMVKKDTVTDFRQRHIVPSRENLTPFYLLKHHPTLCGMLQFHIDRTMCYGGLRTCNEWRCLIGIVHLYNAVRQGGRLQVEWPDMEAVIGFYGVSHLFLGSPPNSPKEYATRHMLAAGLPSSIFARDSRLKQTQRSQEGEFIPIRTSKTSGRFFEVKQPLLTVMRERYSEKKGKKQPGMVIRDVEIALKALDCSVTEPNYKTRILKQWKETRVLTPLDTLQAVRHGVVAEELHMQFDYLTFNGRCLELLRRLRDRLVEKFPAIYWPALALENENLGIVVSKIFEIVAHNDSTADAYLQAVSYAFDEHIRREGSKSIDRAKQRVSDRSNLSN
jgi:hypothetical protein